LIILTFLLKTVSSIRLSVGYMDNLYFYDCRLLSLSVLITVLIEFEVDTTLRNYYMWQIFTFCYLERKLCMHFKILVDKGYNVIYVFSFRT